MESCRLGTTKDFDQSSDRFLDLLFCCQVLELAEVIRYWYLLVPLFAILLQNGATSCKCRHIGLDVQVFASFQGWAILDESHDQERALLFSMWATCAALGAWRSSKAWLWCHQRIVCLYELVFFVWSQHRSLPYFFSHSAWGWAVPCTATWEGRFFTACVFVLRVSKQSTLWEGWLHSKMLTSKEMVEQHLEIVTKSRNGVFTHRFPLW